MSVELRRVTKTFGGAIHAVEDVTYLFREGCITVLLGPSGCGKTTTLRCVAGLEDPDEGEILIDGKVVNDFPPEKRNLGMVFQSYALWPHMTVYENIAFPLRMRKYDKMRATEKAEEVMNLLALENLGDRSIGQLSGGQQQRVALARALVYDPRVLLLDEPLSNLDAKLREKSRVELKKLQRKLGTTVIHVTHDQAEAMALADQVVIMDRGRIIQTGSPREIYERPANSFVADFVGSTNLLPARLVQRRAGMLKLAVSEAFEINAVEVPLMQENGLRVSIRPEDLEVHMERPNNSDNVWKGLVTLSTFMGNFEECLVQVEGVELRVRISKKEGYSSGDAVFLRADPENCTVLA